MVNEQLKRWMDTFIDTMDVESEAFDELIMQLEDFEPGMMLRVIFGEVIDDLSIEQKNWLADWSVNVLRFLRDENRRAKGKIEEWRKAV